MKAFVLSVRVAIVLSIVMYATLGMERSVYANDLPDIRKRGVLRHLGIPYANFVSEDGRDGLDVELIKLFAQYLGVKYEYVRTSWESAISDLTGRRYKEDGNGDQASVRGDLIANGFTILPSRQKAVDFSIPTFPTQVWVIVRSDSSIAPIQPTGDIDMDIRAVKSLLSSRRVLSKPNTCLDPSLYDLEAADVKVINFNGDLNGLAPALLKGDADLSLLDMPDALNALEKWPGKFKIIGPLSPVQNMACAFAKESTLLKDSFNRFFKKVVQDGTYIKLVKKHYPGFGLYYPGYFTAS